MKNTFFSLCVLLFLSCASQRADVLHLPVERIELKNGMRVLLVARKGAPVFSSYLRVKVGGMDEPLGKSGIAHFFEHLAFKGTPTIGKDVQNEFVKIIEENGGGNINATTGNDYTSYFVSMPVSKMELWAYMESERFLHPEYREFDKEKEVVREERRMRTENEPEGRLYEAFVAASFDQSPYRFPVIGSQEEIAGITVEDAKRFREAYYHPDRVVLAIVGNFPIHETKELIEKYFGRIPAVPSQPDLPVLQQTFENFPREKIISDPEEPRFYLGFHRPAYPHPDDSVLDVIQALLCEGRSSRLYSQLVKIQKIALDVGCDSSIPGVRLDGLFTFSALPIPPATNTQVLEALLMEIERMKNEGVTQEELEKIRNQVDAALLWGLDSNEGMASNLSYYESLSGDWKYVIRLREEIRKVTSQDIQRVLRAYFIPERRVWVRTEQSESMEEPVIGH